MRADRFPLALETVFFGGGTPSLLSPSHLERLCSGLKRHADFSGVTEWTIEANPATFDVPKARLMRELGINRASLGVQSWQPETLAVLGRDHSPADAEAACEFLREAGFENVSIDLMFSVPGQTGTSWAADLEKTIALRPGHISAYNLTYEEDTEFLERHDSGEFANDEDRDADLFEMAMDRLGDAGYRHYEISNYARPGFESIHNQAYWRSADFLGIGPGAVTTIGNRRWKTLPDTAAYVRAILSGEDVRTEREALTPGDLRIEAIALQLRTAEGIAESTLLSGGLNPVESLIEQGWIERKNGRVTLTRNGRLVADEIAARLV